MVCRTSRVIVADEYDPANLSLNTESMLNRKAETERDQRSKNLPNVERHPGSVPILNSRLYLTPMILRRISLIMLLTAYLAVSTLRADTITVAHQIDYFPYCWVDDTGLSQGILVDWWELWASKVDKELSFKAATTQRCIQWVNDGEADAVAGLIIDPTQLDTLLFGDYIMRVTTVLYLREDIKPKSIYEIGEPLGILNSGSSKHFITEKYADLKFKEYETADAIMEDMGTRDIAGFFYEEPYTTFELVKSPILEGYYKYLEIRNEKLRPALKAGNTELLTLLQLGTSKILDEELLVIAAKYDLIPQKDKLPMAVIGGSLLLLLAGGGYYFWRINLLKKQMEPEDAQRRNWKVIIEKGESDRIEFKSSLRWDYREEKANKVLEDVIVKNISAFLNTEGGMLFIGVDDDGNILGLENDYQVLRKGNADGFLLVMTNLINKHFGKHTHRLIHSNIVIINGKQVCIVEMSKSEKPVFLKKGEKEKFYIRAAAASLPLGLQEATDYIRSHWGSNK
jgi:Schlafen, AlbA_2/Bacterial extracellular solute-binding proteins, family 3